MPISGDGFILQLKTKPPTYQSGHLFFWVTWGDPFTGDGEYGFRVRRADSGMVTEADMADVKNHFRFITWDEKGKC